MELPVAFTDYTRSFMGAEEYNKLAEALGGEQPVSIRLNEDKLGGSSFSLFRASFRPVPWAGTGFYLPDRLTFTFDPLFHAGCYYVQEAASMFVEQALRRYTGDVPVTMLDLCAAPGGKSTHARSVLPKGSLLVANEVIRNRSQILAENLTKWGHPGVVVTNNDPADFSSLTDFFDILLTDVPCSGEGMFRKESVAVTQYDQPLLDRCAALGAEILENAAAMLAPGGILVYSTCTFAPGEDEGQIAAFLARHPEFTLCDLSGCGFGQPGEANRTGDYPLQAEYCRRIWPCDGGEGHFMAKLQKAADAPAVELPRGKNGKGKGGKTPRMDAKALQAWQSFAKELFPTLAGQPIAVVGDGFLLEPPALLPAAKLHVLRAGVPAGRAAKGRFEPAHALFMAYGAQCTNCEELTLADPRTAAWLRGEEIEAQTAQNGWCAVLVDGFPLGGGKASGGRIKNHYPKALRNLK